MSIFEKRVSREEFEKLKGENNQMRFEIERLQRSNENLLEQLKNQAPKIDALMRKINEQHNYIDKYHIEVTSDKEKFAKHEAIDKPRGRGKGKGYDK